MGEHQHINTIALLASAGIQLAQEWILLPDSGQDTVWPPPDTPDTHKGEPVVGSVGQDHPGLEAGPLRVVSLWLGHCCQDLAPSNHKVPH